MADDTNQSTEAPKTPEEEEAAKKKKMYMWIAIAILGILLVGGIAFVFGTNNAVSDPIRGIIIKTESTPTPAPSMAPKPTDVPTPTDEPDPSEEPIPTDEPEPTDEPDPTDEPEEPTPTDIEDITTP